MKKYKIESSNIDEISYNLKTQELIVTFKGGSSYKYQCITQQAVCRLLFADSVGREFHDSIKINKAIKLEDQL